MKIQNNTPQPSPKFYILKKDGDDIKLSGTSTKPSSKANVKAKLDEVQQSHFKAQNFDSGSDWDSDEEEPKQEICQATCPLDAEFYAELMKSKQLQPMP